MLRSIVRIGVVLSLGFSTVSALAQDGNWRIRNGSVGAFADWARVLGVKPITGDFNGDGHTDVALIRQTPGWGSMPLALANGVGGWSIRNGGVGAFAAWASTTGVEPLTGDFNGDGLTDVALIRRTPGWGSIPIAFANGVGGWNIKNTSVSNFAGWAHTFGVKPLTR